jgi:predicted dehydrogenase
MGNAHRARFEHNADRMTVTACVDIIPERAEQAAANFGARAATDFEEVLPDVDAVLIALPHPVHHPVGMACLEAGKHVLMEKPLAINEAQCLDLIAAREKSGTVLMNGYSQRYNPLMLFLAELLFAKKYGECFHLSMWTEQYTRASDPDFIYTREALGGGQLFSHGCHYIDLLMWMLGEPLEGHHLGTNFGTPWMEREGTSDVVMKFASGAVGYHGGTWGAKGTRLGYSFHAQCEEGMIELDQFNGIVALHRGDKHADEDRGVKILMEHGDNSKHTDREMRHFLDCIDGNLTPFTNAEDALQSLRVIWRLYEAEDTGRIADLRGLGVPQTPIPDNLRVSEASVA